MTMQSTQGSPSLFAGTTAGHVCQKPTNAVAGSTYPPQPDWTCGVCGRVWRDWISGHLRYWAEVRGPNV